MRVNWSIGVKIAALTAMAAILPTGLAAFVGVEQTDEALDDAARVQAKDQLALVQRDAEAWWLEELLRDAETARLRKAPTPAAAPAGS
jgi:hypothetical protein